MTNKPGTSMTHQFVSLSGEVINVDSEQNGSAQLPSSTLPSPTLAVFAPYKLLNLRLPGVLRE